MTTATDIRDMLKDLGAPIEPSTRDVSIILAAGHGKRIKSSMSKMLHEIWGKPSVARVAEACEGGLDAPGQVIVVGIKAEEVARALSGRPRVSFAYQPEQNGTGHAVACALEGFEGHDMPERVYVFPGDMGLLHKEAVRELKDAFDASPYDMMVMTGLYDGPSSENYYGRIVRAPETDANGEPSGDAAGKVIEIKEHKDILALEGDYVVEFHGREFRFTRDDLLGIREFNTSVYAFKGDLLRKYIGCLGADNVQGEVYLTDLIAVFNHHGHGIGAVSPKDPTVVLGFNNKSVLRKMEDMARQRVYDRLKDILTFEAPDDFFIADETVEDLIRLDREVGTLDIIIGPGARVGAGVKLNVHNTIVRQASLSGDITLGRRVTIGRNVQMSCYPGQKMTIGDDVEIGKGNIIQGNVEIGDGARIETPVNITGSDEHPARIGARAVIKGTTYVFGSIVEDDVTVLHSVLMQKRVERVERKDGTVQGVAFYLPLPKGIDCIDDLP